MIDSVDYTEYIGRRVPAVVGDLRDALFKLKSNPTVLNSFPVDCATVRSPPSLAIIHRSFLQPIVFRPSETDFRDD